MKALVPLLAVGLMVVSAMPGQTQEGKEKDKPEGKWKLTSKQASAGAGHTFELYSGSSRFCVGRIIGNQS